MTVLMREELNDADLAWAAADPSVAGVMGQLLRARQSEAANLAPVAVLSRESRVVDPAVLRARGAL